MVRCLQPNFNACLEAAEATASEVEVRLRRLGLLVTRGLLVLVVRLVILVLIVRVVVLLVIIRLILVTIVVVARLVITLRAISGSLSWVSNLRCGRGLRAIGGSCRSGRGLSRVSRARAGTGASIRVASANLLGLTAVSDALESDALFGDVGELDTGDLGSVAHVRVDADEDLSVGGRTTRDLDVASGHLLAVTAAAVELAKVRDLEVLDDDGTSTVVLDDLVLGTSSAATVNSSGLAVFLLLNGESVLADGVPDNVVKSAATVAVNTLDLVGTCNS
jgi:hypothetical protein